MACAEPDSLDKRTQMRNAVMEHKREKWVKRKAVSPVQWLSSFFQSSFLSPACVIVSVTYWRLQNHNSQTVVNKYQTIYFCNMHMVALFSACFVFANFHKYPWGKDLKQPLLLWTPSQILTSSNADYFMSQFSYWEKTELAENFWSYFSDKRVFVLVCSIGKGNPASK